MKASAEHSPALADSGLVAERTADHPGRGAAPLLAALRVTYSATWQDVQVRRHAGALLDAPTAAPGHEHPAALEVLRTALVNTLWGRWCRPSAQAVVGGPALGYLLKEDPRTYALGVRWPGR